MQNTNAKIEKFDLYTSLEDDILSCLNHENEPMKRTRLKALLRHYQTFIRQDDANAISFAVGGDQPADENANDVCALKGDEQYRQLHRSFCKDLIRELIQQHVYAATNSSEWEFLENKKHYFTLQIRKCNDPAELKKLMRDKEAITGRIENLLINSVYYGALGDSMAYPDTFDELRCMFGDRENPNIAFERFDKCTHK